MSDEITGREPALPDDDELTGDEPMLGGDRRPVFLAIDTGWTASEWLERAYFLNDEARPVDQERAERLIMETLARNSVFLRPVVPDLLRQTRIHAIPLSPEAVQHHRELAALDEPYMPRFRTEPILFGDWSVDENDDE